VQEADHFGQRFQGCQALVSGFGPVFSLSLEVLEKGEDQIYREVFDPEGVDFDGMILCGKGQKEAEGIPIGFDGIWAYPFDPGQILIEELMNTSGELHMRSSWDLAKSIRP